MKFKLSITILFVLLSIEVQAQLDPVAPEVWSKPKIIKVIAGFVSRAESPSISFDGTKLYFNGIAVTEKTDTGWSTPKFLNSNVNQNLATQPCISPNGKRLFFSWYVGTWDLYYSDWDSTTKDWGAAKSCGPGVNTPQYAEMGCTMPDDTTLIFLRTNISYISHWNSSTQTWDTAVLFPTKDIQFQSDLGIYVMANREKEYDADSHEDTTLDGKYYLNYYISVSYRDTTNPRGYTIPYRLNICVQSDSEYLKGNYVGRFEGYPDLTPDGKTMYFAADYNGQLTIYETHLLVDENGDTVTSIRDGRTNNLLPKEIKLYPAYPNPFNPSTKIKYSINKSIYITLSVYDVLGRKIKQLYSGYKRQGEYEEQFNASELTSGVYFIVLNYKEGAKVEKVLLLK